jgi:hypothetical protein
MWLDGLVSKGDRLIGMEDCRHGQGLSADQGLRGLGFEVLQGAKPSPLKHWGSRLRDWPRREWALKW